MSPLTPRELRIIADHVERLTKARVVNAQLGIDTTPDLMVVDFPNGYTSTVIWMPGAHSDDPRRRQRIAQHARHRDCYQLDVATITVTASGAAAAMVTAGAIVTADMVQGLDVAATLRKIGSNPRT
ncbi:hypothetical protein OG693_39740 (plasmid) [Streptomyces sp. NBC_01259]|uniref:hypothetical protein n=1 Tax=Streptomyces sp. NBC_01259 TaxID=2903800 RepID=UPI002F90D44D